MTQKKDTAKETDWKEVFASGPDGLRALVAASSIPLMVIAAVSNRLNPSISDITQFAPEP